MNLRVRSVMGAEGSDCKKGHTLVNKSLGRCVGSDGDAGEGEVESTTGS